MEVVISIAIGVMASAGVWLVLRGLSALSDLPALVIAVTIGVALYGGLLHLIAPDRLAEALRFVRNRGETEDAAQPTPAE